jgi:hypothetical protein
MFAGGGEKPYAFKTIGEGESKTVSKEFLLVNK